MAAAFMENPYLKVYLNKGLSASKQFPFTWKNNLRCTRPHKSGGAEVKLDLVLTESSNRIFMVMVMRASVQIQSKVVSLKK